MEGNYACVEVCVKLVDGKEYDILKYLVNAVLAVQDVATILTSSMPDNVKKKAAWIKQDLSASLVDIFHCQFAPVLHQGSWIFKWYIHEIIECSICLNCTSENDCFHSNSRKAWNYRNTFIIVFNDLMRQLKSWNQLQ